MLPTSAGVEPATSWSPVGRRIQLSHRGWLNRSRQCILLHTRLTTLSSLLKTGRRWNNITFKLILASFRWAENRKYFRIRTGRIINAWSRWNNRYFNCSIWFNIRNKNFSLKACSNEFSLTNAHLNHFYFIGWFNNRKAKQKYGKFPKISNTLFHIFLA